MRHVLIAVTIAFALTSTYSAQQPPRKVNLSGTVVAVNQQSDSITLIDLKTMAVASRYKIGTDPFGGGLRTVTR